MPFLELKTTTKMTISANMADEHASETMVPIEAIQTVDPEVIASQDPFFFISLYFSLNTSSASYKYQGSNLG